MAVRFRKSVKLAKGVRINFSKSGASLSLGGRGNTFNFSSRGVYHTLGIPGTGLSARTRLSSGLSGGSSRSSNRAESPSYRRLMEYADDQGHLPLRAGVDGQGNINFYFEDCDDAIDDPELLKEIKKLPEVKEAMPELKAKQQIAWDELQRSTENESKKFVDLYKLTPHVVTYRAFKSRLEKLSVKTYERREYEVPCPEEETVRGLLEQEAQQEVKGFFKKKKIEKYVEDYFDDRLNAAVYEWNQAKSAFEREEDEREARANAEYREEYEGKKLALERGLEESDETIMLLVEEWLQELTLPVDMSAQIDCTEGVVFVDLDLPEIEDMPQTTAKQLKSGKVKLVDKTQKQLKLEYATCVLGLALFIAGSIFNLNAYINEIWISGYTQRRNKDGDIADDYIYSVKISREQFRKAVIENPIDTFCEFENRLKLSAAYAFGTIKPFEPIMS